MFSRKARIAGLVGVALAASSVQAQPPAGLPGVGAAGPGAGNAAVAAVATPGGGVAAVAAPAAPKTIFGLFGITKANCQACKAKLCQSQLGLMINSMLTGPIGGISGGFIPPLCPPAPSAAAVAALAAGPAGPGGAAAVAAKIQQSEADAKARVVAVEYLGTVDCSHWPEATLALIKALRTDQNECVRFAAARALSSGCCCSKETILALKASVSGESGDENPAETSPRVKAAAFSALQNCLMRVPEELPPEPPPVVEPPPPTRENTVPTAPPIPPPPREGPTASAPVDENAQLSSARFSPTPRRPTYQERLRRMTYGQAVDEARSTLFRVAETPQQSVPVLPSGKRDVFHALTKARQDLRSVPREAPPGPSDPAVRPTSYIPADPGDSGATPAPVGPAVRPSPDSGRSAAGPNEPASNRGLFGLIFKPKGTQTGE